MLSFARVTRSQAEGPCGNTVVSGPEIEEARRLFQQHLPTATSGLSIVQRLAVSASAGTKKQRRTDDGTDNAGSNIGTLEDGGGGERTSRVAFRTPLSQRVVNSHLQYFHKFTPFREGRFNKDTLYEFLFFTVVENHLRLSYARRVLRNLLSYVRRYIEENYNGVVVANGPTTVRVVIPIAGVGGGGGDDTGTTITIDLTPESVAFFHDNPRGIVVQSSRFYQLMNAVGNQTDNPRMKNIVCEARRQRDLVFTEQQNAALLEFTFTALRVLAEKYLSRPTTSGWDFPLNNSSSGGDGVTRLVVDSFVSAKRSVNESSSSSVDRVVFEFCVAFLIGFLTGARIKSTITRLTVGEVDRLVRGEPIEKLTKGSFAHVFIPAGFACSDRGEQTGQSFTPSWYSTTNSTFDPPHRESVANTLYEITVLRRDPLLYRSVAENKVAGGSGNSVTTAATAKTTESSVRDQYFFHSGGRQLDSTFDRIFEALFQQRRPKGVFWHSQRRRYLGAVNDRCGAVTASKSVGHSDVETTMSYINKSMHREDTDRRAGSAVYEEMMRLMGADGIVSTRSGSNHVRSFFA